jgi:hypothetical protein
MENAGAAFFIAGIAHRLVANDPQGCPQMKIKPEQLDRLVDDILKAYRAKDLITLKAPETTVRAKIKETLVKNFHDEEAIEEEAREMLASHAGDMRRAGEMDQHRMFLLIKQKIAQKKGFVL